MVDKPQYPRVTSSAWFTLRQRAETSPSVRFSPQVVATITKTNPKSATDNVLGGLRRMGLIDDDGALTERGNRWRLPATYSDACEEIIDSLYPPELRSFVDADGDPDVNQIADWMALHGFGTKSANVLASTYALVARKRIDQPQQSGDRKAQPKGPSKAKARPPMPQPKTSHTSASHSGDYAPAAPPPPAEKAAGRPNVHIDIQVHIPATASPEQIDKIFESMAKHLYQE
jgi:hypothetical protein